MSIFQKLVAKHGTAMRVKEGGHVFMQGDLCSQVFMVRNGLLKAYYIRADGKEHIKSFQPEGSIIGSMVALMDAEAATFSLVAVEDSDLVALPYSQLADAARSDIQLAGALIEFLSAYGKRKERREFELLCLSPEDRFGLLQETMPSLLDRVSQADLAAYIGITPQALSRIKRRIKR